MSTNDTAAIYLRISSDPSGERAGVERQRTEALTLAERLNLDVVAVFEDNDRSAYSHKPRPEFEDMLTAAQAGDFGHVIAWSSDRLYRRVADLVRITDELAPHVKIHTVMGGEVDLSTAEGLLRAQVMGSVGEFESRRKGERIAARAKQRAQVDRRMTASNRPRGWEWVDPCPGGEGCRHKTRCEVGENHRARIGSRSGLRPHLTEAPILAAAYRDVASGLTMNAAWKRAVAAGLEITAATTLRALLLNCRNAGLVAHKGAIIGEASDGHRIVTRDLYEQVSAILTDPSRKTSPGRPAGVRLGGGIAVCPRCGGNLAAGRKADGHGKGEMSGTYVCSKHKHFSVRRARLDAPVLDLVGEVLTRLSASGDLTLPEADNDAAGDLRAQIGGIETKLDALSTLMAAGDLDPADYASAARKLRDRRDTLTAALARRNGRPALADLAGHSDGVQAAWGRVLATADAGDPEPLRAVLRELLVHARPQLNWEIHLEWQPWVGPAPQVIPPLSPMSHDREARQATVAELWNQGLNILQIAEKIGSQRATVRGDLEVLGLRQIPRRKATAA